MPFGLDIKSFVLGVIFAMWGLPFLMGLVNRRGSAAAA